MRFLLAMAMLSAFAGAAQAANSVTPGEFVIERPTLKSKRYTHRAMRAAQRFMFRSSPAIMSARLRPARRRSSRRKLPESSSALGIRIQKPTGAELRR